MVKKKSRKAQTFTWGLIAKLAIAAIAIFLIWMIIRRQGSVGGGILGRLFP